ncbi:AMP-binding enzyme domain-containing protein [Cladophialophora immunda]|nr:AMP-binding enzyme domain-containing protein [Cladophialophora immunda]
MDVDRTAIVPSAQGPRILPNFLLFNRLVFFAHRKNKVVINDVTAGVAATHVQLLTDVLNFRNHIRSRLSPQTIRKLQTGEEVFICILAPGGYEYAVAFLAVLALGAVIVPLSSIVPVQEACYYVNKCRAVAILASSSQVVMGKAVEVQARGTVGPEFQCLEILPHIHKTPFLPTDITVSSDLYMDLNAAGLIIFTSGTTGPPKGAVLRRGFFVTAGLEMADEFGISVDDVVLHTLPVHHATGIQINFLPFLINGACIEFQSGGFDPAWTWNRWRQGGLTFFSGVPTTYMRLMQHYEKHLSQLPPDELKSYVSSVRQFKALVCGTSALPYPLHQKWKALTGGKNITTRYGATEFGPVFRLPIGATDLPEGSVGIIAPAADVKLSTGSFGEVLVRTSSMFSKYILDPEATARAHDAQGYFKTGDIARKEGPYYFILGRESVDIIKSGGYKISALDIERELLGLDYVAEAAVIGAEDEEFGQRTAAIVVLNKEKITGPLTLHRLRRDLRARLSSYKLPTLLRVVDEIPKNASGKVPKKVLGPQLFPKEGHRDVQIWRGKATVESRL